MLLPEIFFFFFFSFHAEIEADAMQAYMLYLQSETGPAIGFVSLNERSPDVPPVRIPTRSSYLNFKSLISEFRS